MGEFFRKSGLVLAVAATVCQASLPALAARAPHGGVAAGQRLLEGRRAESEAGTYDISFVPVLLELARVLGRYQPPPGYFLLNEPFSNHPGIDLQQLLFQQSSPLSVPGSVDLNAAGRPPQGPDGPTLAVPSIKGKVEPPAEARNGSAVPRLAARPLASDLGSAPVSSQSTRVASPEQISLAIEDREIRLAPVFITFDFQGLSAALTGIGTPARQVPRFALETPQVLTPVGSVAGYVRESRATGGGFMLWTLKPATAGGAQRQAASQPAREFKGTFIACAQGARFKSIRSRRFELSGGRLVAGNNGESLLFLTPLGTVRVPDGAAALIDMDGDHTLRVVALASTDPDTVEVEFHTSSGRSQSAALRKGEELILGDHELSAREIAGRDGLPRSVLSGGGTVARTSLDLGQLSRREPLLDEAHPSLSAQQRSALQRLRRQFE